MVQIVISYDDHESVPKEIINYEKRPLRQLFEEKHKPDIKARGTFDSACFNGYDISQITDVNISGDFSELPEIFYSMPLKSLKIKSTSKKTFIIDDRILSFGLETLSLNCTFNHKTEKWDRGDNVFDIEVYVMYPQIYLMTSLQFLECVNGPGDGSRFGFTDELVNLTNLKSLILRTGYCYGSVPQCVALIQEIDTYSCYHTPDSFFVFGDHMHIYNDLFSKEHHASIDEPRQKYYYSEIPLHIKCLTVSYGQDCGMCGGSADPTHTNVINEISKSSLEVLRINSKFMFLELINNIDKIPSSLKRLEINNNIMNNLKINERYNTAMLSMAQLFGQELYEDLSLIMLSDKNTDKFNLRYITFEGTYEFIKTKLHEMSAKIEEIFLEEKNKKDRGSSEDEYSEYSESSLKYSRKRSSRRKKSPKFSAPDEEGWVTVLK